MTFMIKKSQWGWTAYHPSGRPIAHSESKALLESYLKECTG